VIVVLVAARSFLVPGTFCYLELTLVGGVLLSLIQTSDWLVAQHNDEEHHPTVRQKAKALVHKTIQLFLPFL